MAYTEIPAMHEYNLRGAFRFWCQKVLPAVYDDSLSYYELLCKVVDYLNTTMEDVTNLTDDVTVLHDYVENYFENLDVTEEINNKLDQMAEDGTLYAIIERFTQPIIDEQNERIEDGFADQNTYLHESINTQTQTINNGFSSQNDRIAVLEARMDTFASLPDGSLSTAADAELVDIRDGYQGNTFGDAGTAVRTQINGLYSSIKANTVQNVEFEQHGLSPEGADVTAPNRCRSIGYISKKFSVSVINTLPNVYALNIFYFDANKRLIGSLGVWDTKSINTFDNPDIKYLRINVKHVNDTTMDADADPALLNKAVYLVYNDTKEIETIYENLEPYITTNELYYYPAGYVWYINGTSFPTTIPSNPVASRLAPIKVPGGTVIIPTSNAQVKVYAYKASDNTPLFSSDPSYFHEGNVYVTPEECIVYLNVAIYPSATTGDIKTALPNVSVKYPYSYVKTLIKPLIETVDRYQGNYFIDCMFKRTNVMLTQHGILSNMQSFCRYNNKYYSTSGSKITAQNNRFEVLSSADIETGHGNSFQIGSSNLGYISGWDDNKVYVINMDDLTLVNTINLPTTGYTTCAIDDVNSIAYIFQRGDYPTTEAYYNFIAYDYANDTVLYRKKTTMKMEGMQACDFVDGKIFVLNGLSGAESKNGYRIFNTNCDLIGEFNLNLLANFEPEGVFVDREDYTIYLSIASGLVYTLRYAL